MSADEFHAAQRVTGDVFFSDVARLALFGLREFLFEREFRGGDRDDGLAVAREAFGRVGLFRRERVAVRRREKIGARRLLALTARGGLRAVVEREDRRLHRRDIVFAVARDTRGVGARGHRLPRPSRLCLVRPRALTQPRNSPPRFRGSAKCGQRKLAAFFAPVGDDSRGKTAAAADQFANCGSVPPWARRWRPLAGREWGKRSRRTPFQAIFDAMAARVGIEPTTK